MQGHCFPAAVCFVGQMSASTSSENKILQGQAVMVAVATLQFLGDSDRF